MSAFKLGFAKKLSRLGIFVYDIVVLAGLAVLALLYLESHRPNGLLAGKIDTASWGGYGLFARAMWFGALGGITISLKGVYEHRGDASSPWNPGFNLWHLGRPISGAVAGLMTFLVLEVLNLKGASPQPPNDYIVYVAAFVFGTQENRFFNLLYEIAKLIVSVPSDKTAPGDKAVLDDESAPGDKENRGLRVVAIEPDVARPGDVVIVRGGGIGKGASARLGGRPLEKPVVADDGSSIAGLAPAGVAGSDPVEVMVVNADGVSFVLPGKFRFRAQGA